jgi:prepilin-type N-terminal cleavage/methylation domain-containing protein
MSRLRASSCRHRTADHRPHAVHKPAFTLVELLVVVVILTVLASLSLAGLAGARQRAKIDKTRSTISKIDAVIRPMYDSYRTRRVTTSGTTTSQIGTSRLTALRTLMLREMPDVWADVPATAPAAGTAWYTGAVKGYVSYQTNLSPNYSSGNASHECLFMIVARSGYEPDALEMFRSDEIIDSDGDRAKEFADGWGSPIAFMRWPSGFTSPLQNTDATRYHDPFDPLRLDATAYALTPLVYSPGPDEKYGLDKLDNWSSQSLNNICTVTTATGQLPGQPDSSDSTAYRDNITNHDLSKK